MSNKAVTSRMPITQNKSILGGVLALVLATSCCWLPALIIALGGASGMMAFSNGLESYSGYLMIVGIVLLVYGAYQFNKSRSNMKSIILKSTLTCPKCGHQKTEEMPTDACQYFYECESCKEIIKPKEGDCCVYCSYGSVACPPIQEGANCCS